MAVAHNIARELGVIQAAPVTPTLEAICMADFGDTGIIFMAAPVLPNTRVSWSKVAFEKFFLTKMRLGMSVPWFERWGLRVLSLSLVEPISHGLILELQLVGVNPQLPTTKDKN